MKKAPNRLWIRSFFCTFVCVIQDEIKFKILQALGHVPTADQREAVEVFAQFMTTSHEQPVMILRGSAGTGKTTLAGAIVRALKSLGRKLVLMAPTGRAAKVFSIYADHPAYTIHRRIYRQMTSGDRTMFRLNDNLHTDTLFIVDEASMIANDQTSDLFGSGCLLDDLTEFVYTGRGCSMLLIGDRAQLPPVGESDAPALTGRVMRGYGLTVYETDLDEVLRQSSESGILSNATAVRNLLLAAEQGEPLIWPRLRLRGFTDIQRVEGSELIEALADSYAQVGMDDTIVVTRSNKRAIIYNQGIRNTILEREERLSHGDQLMIVKNKYGVTVGEADEDTPDFLANGDRCVVQRVRHERELHGFTFADATLVLPDYNNFEIDTVVILDTLTSEAPALTSEQHEQLYRSVMEDYADLPYKADRVRALKSDPYYNALQVKYGYAVTCHKAQGGQWAHVYIDQGYITDDMLTPDYVHWLYTALTRATEKVFLVNWKHYEE